MAYITAKKRQGASGILTYYYLVEGYRKDGKVKHRTLQYLGTSPNHLKMTLTQDVGVSIAKILSNTDLSKEDIRKELESLGLQLPPGELKEVKLVFTPPSKELSVHFYCTK